MLLDAAGGEFDLLAFPCPHHTRASPARRRERGKMMKEEGREGEEDEDEKLREEEMEEILY